LLDPYCGLDDIKDKILCCVDETTFVEDPLRLFRAVGFSGRFDFTCKQNLINLCQQMYLNGSLESLAKERVFDEIKKLLLLSNRPSTGFKLLSQMEALRYFDELYTLDKNSFSKTLDMLDTLAKRDIKDDKLKLKLMFCVLTLQMRRVEDVNNFVKSLTDEINLTKDILSLYQSYRDFLTSNLTDFKIKTIALHVKIQELYILTAVTDDAKIRLKGEELLSRAKSLHVSDRAPQALLKGRHLIQMGLKPSKEFSQLLSKSFEAQLNGEFDNLTDAKIWLKSHL
jgi:tRNA nucleotidyltransferase (CCA-adding enzyme)